MKLSVGLGGVVLALATVACTTQFRNQEAAASKPRPTAEAAEPMKFPALTDLAPQTVPYKNAALILAGTSVPVQLESKDEGGKLSFKLIAHGEELMTEKYSYDGSAFSFVGSTGEEYEPAIPLLTFPFDSNEKRSWKGTIQYGDASEPCDATIVSKPDTLNIEGGNFQTLLVTVNLSYGGSAQKPTQRLLKFWFAPKKGMVKRDFGLNSTRQPAADATP